MKPLSESLFSALESYLSPLDWIAILRARAVANQFSCRMDLKIGQLMHQTAENSHHNEVPVSLLTEREDIKKRAYTDIVESCSCECCKSANHGEQPCHLSLALLGL